MLAKCVRDTWDSKNCRLYTRSEQYDIDLKSPCVIHFTSVPGATPEDVQALAQAQRAEEARAKAEMETKRVAKTKEDGEDEFADMKLAQLE